MDLRESFLGKCLLINPFIKADMFEYVDDSFSLYLHM